MKIVGISGPSCSGKSTLARHLRQVLPHSALIYEDDFYKPESELPLDCEGRPNWDVPESFDLAEMRRSLAEIKSSGVLPSHIATREDQNNPSDLLLTDEEAKDVHRQLVDILGNEPVLLVDGILLFHAGSPVEDIIDLKLMMPFNFEELKKRRDARKGYATADNGFWVDPPNFFDDVVWPEFVAHCGFLYRGRDYRHLSSAALSRNIELAPDKTMRESILAIGRRLAGDSEKAISVH